MHTIIRRVLPQLVLLAVMTMPASILAQGDARFSGTVIDPSGAFVPGAMITIALVKRALLPPTTRGATSFPT
jgi:hypothetical protein